MEGVGEDRVARDVIAPLIEGDAPWIRVRIAAESDEPVLPRRVAEPGRVLRAHGPEPRLDCEWWKIDSRMSRSPSGVRMKSWME